MELKRSRLPYLFILLRLLIVPYGIETSIFKYYVYSIELLIVPYGIETYSSTLILSTDSKLLIVPYGIETEQRIMLNEIGLSFNCTLWN